MIFVTVGTSQFSTLIQKIDSMVADGMLSGDVCCQIGSGTYIPKHCDYFRFKPSIEEWIQKASLVICHGGTGTVCPLLTATKPFIVVSNTSLADDHQTQFLQRLSKLISFLWTTDMEELPLLIEKAYSFEIKRLNNESLADDLKLYINSPIL